MNARKGRPANIRFFVIGERSFEKVIRHLRGTFFKDEPLNQSVQMGGLGDHAQLEKHCNYTLAEGLSVMALDPYGKVAGVCLNGVARPGEWEAGLAALPSNPDKGFIKIFQLLYEENLKLDLFRRYETEEIFEMRILSVDSRFRGLGIAKDLMTFSTDLAVKEGFKVLKGEATGLFSQKILQGEQFLELSEARYESKFNPDGSPMFPVKPPHESLKIMIKLVG